MTKRAKSGPTRGRWTVREGLKAGQQTAIILPDGRSGFRVDNIPNAEANARMLAAAADGLDAAEQAIASFDKFGEVSPADVDKLRAFVDRALKGDQ